MTTKVSVIIPIYNVEKYLNRALDSLVNQTLQEIEIICVNDASTDNSLKILEKYAGNDNRIRILENEINKGQSFSRNRAIKLAEGEYLQYVDGDDYLERDALEVLYDKAKNNNLDLLRFNYEKHDEFYNEPRINKKIYSDYTNRNVLSGKEFFKALVMNRSLLLECYSWLNFYRRDWILNNNILFREGIIFEDILYTYQALHSANRCMTYDVKKYHYFLRPSSTVTMHNNERHIYGHLVCINEIIKEMSHCESYEDMLASEVFIFGVKNNMSHMVMRNRTDIDISLWEKEIMELYSSLFRSACYVDFPFVYQYMNEIKQAVHVCIYGAGKASMFLIEYLRKCNVRPEIIAVSDITDNPKSKGGIRVCNISDVTFDDEDCIWLSAIKDKFSEVRSILKAHGFTNVIDTTMI